PELPLKLLSCAHRPAKESRSRRRRSHPGTTLMNKPLVSLPKPRGFLPAASRRGFRSATEIINQDIDTYQEHPDREDHYNPLNVAPANQEKQRKSIADKSYPAWCEARADRERGGRYHEHRRHLDRV